MSDQSLPVSGQPIPDDLLDLFERVQRRMRPLIARPPIGQLPMPSLGHPLDVAKLIACAELLDLAGRGPVAIKDLAESQGLDHSTVSRLIGELEDDGLVERGSDPDDRRRRTIALTALGTAVAIESRQLSRVFSRVLFAEWDEQEMRSFLGSLERLVETAHDRIGLLKDLARSSQAVSGE